MESLLAIRWVHSVLTGSVELMSAVPGGFQERPLEGTPSPWGRVESIGQAEDVRADEGGHLIWARPTLLITVFDRFGNYSRLEPIGNYIYTLLNGKFYPEIAGGTIFSCVRDFASQGVEGVGGQEVRRVFQQFSFYAADEQQP